MAHDSNRNRLLLSTAFTVALLSTTGCRGFQGFFTPPGPLNKQQASAVVHDPYPQNDIGPYDAASRPPNYQQPLAEPVRNRLIPDAMPWLGR